MQFTITRRWYSALPQITVEIDAKYEQSNNAVRLGAAVKVVIGQARKAGTGADLTRAVLTHADLTDAVLTHADLTGAVLKRADLTHADLTGADLTDAVLTHADLTDAVLTHADLTGAVLKRADLTRADLTGAVLTDAVLTHADLTGAVLTDAVLTHADLTGADLTGAVLTDAIPAIENIDAAIYAAITDGEGSLDMGQWHDQNCQTTHCRAGWAIVLAGDAGRALEAKYGPAAAGALIYANSRPGVPVPDFYAGEKAALADIKAHAGVE